MDRILIAGGGKIGSLIARLLVLCGDYEVFLVDISKQVINKQQLPEPVRNLRTLVLDVTNQRTLTRFLEQHKIKAVVSALPFHCNRSVADAVLRAGLYYFDLSEDVDNAQYIRQLTDDNAPACIPQCGLAPGFISIITNHLMTHFESIDTVKMRVGTLPLHPNNSLKYSLTWSTDGLINEYVKPCYGLEGGEMVELRPLEGYETITLDGDRYEAFNTSGGLGTLVETFAGKVNSMNYKTLRYPGHCEKMQLLLHDLKLNRDRSTLKRILENAVPQTLQDVVIIYASVTGKRQGALFEETDVRKIYPKRICSAHWSAIQVTTASGLCSILDLTLQRKLKGFVTQESFALNDFLNNRFGHYYDSSSLHADRLRRQTGHKTA